MLTAVPSKSKAHTFKITPDQAYNGMLESSIPHVLTIDDGDSVIFNTVMLQEGKLRADMTYQEFTDTRSEVISRGNSIYPLTGPFFIKGAEPGNVLEVRIKRIVPGDYAVNFIHPDEKKLGGLPDGAGVKEGLFRTLRISADKKTAEFIPGVTLPLSPFLGFMAVAPKPGGKHPPGVPSYFAGNMDNKELIAGTALFIPVNVPGALFMAADAHAMQGDGESCGNAAETYAEEVEMEFIVRKDMKLERLMAETPTHWITMGFHEDLDEAARIALRDAIAFLSAAKGLSTEEAYGLCSLAVDFRVTQIVDGNKGIHSMIPKSIFRKIEN